MEISKFKETPFLGILRGIEPQMLEPLLDVVILSGLQAIEITMNTHNAKELIRKAVNISGRRLMIGAGTVLNMESLQAALDAGATFIVTPVLVEDVVGYCANNKIPVFPGALTPQEIYNAWNAGATMVKVFPAKFFGPAYFKEVKAPLQDMKLLACGGINPDNIKEYFSCGADAVAFGASVFRKEWIKNKDFRSIGESIKRLVQSAGR
ncbi:MAG: bifunctional 4-hydroxy-2-oxoglutarate aldolase/2-dehydro-3-deoxy-phosphogluconate aldolase [Candidatus Omnitrophica bacterium]|nr:bifunctional 4-hydroxy-2-oxoglutarate aldolase/2-dehydro-3-deoxy-phosphogluconate aldolase [Candidatus Omnitrophota bacterium]